MNRLANLDLAVLAGYLLVTTVASLWLARRARSTEAYVHGSGGLPGWAVALSIFGSYISSISYLANPGKSFASNWNAFVFSLATPIAALIAVVWIVPYYRRIGGLSAYEPLEARFGPWARAYAVICYLLTQMARTGTIIYLLAKATEPLLGWEIESVIWLTGGLMIACSMFGGLPAIVWVGVVHGVTLIAGPIICLVAIVSMTSGGVAETVRAAADANKFSLGSTSFDLTQATIWVALAYGLVINLSNFAVDQGYIQRYTSIRGERSAQRSTFWGACLYVPVAAVFFFIGTALFVLLAQRPDLLPANIDFVDKPDSVFPWFISTQLPPGVAGLVVAGVFAAALDPSLNSMTVLTLNDLYLRYLRPRATERESLWALRLGTLGWGLVSIAVALAMIDAKQILDVWWELAGVFSGGLLGLFLLGRTTRASSGQALFATSIGIAAILWLTLSPNLYNLPTDLRNPLHPLLTAVLGSAIVWLVGGFLSKFTPSRALP